MNEFLAKKMGEVLAFCTVGAETLERGKAAFERVFGADGVAKMISMNRAQGEALKQIAGETGVTDAVMAKTEKTGAKLREMRDLYVAGRWDDSAELLEWSGFFEGAAIVHWAIVQGGAEAGGIANLQQLAGQGFQFHTEFLNNVSEKIKTVRE